MAPFGPFLHSLTHNTVAPTMVNAGLKVNVLPSECELRVDCRIVPGTDPAQFVAAFTALITSIDPQAQVSVLETGPPVASEYKNSPVWNLAREVLLEADTVGEVSVVPSVVQGFTDARAFAELGLPCFGFSPLWFPPQINFGALFHGHNERVPVHGFRWGAATFYEFVTRPGCDGC